MILRRTSRRPAIGLSVVLVAFNMARELPKTLFSLSPAYQRYIDRDDFEVIVVDNGSDPPVDTRPASGASGRLRVIRIEDAPPSPAHAVNVGIAASRGAVVGVMVDGARIASPGLLHFGRQGALLHDRAVAAALGWYLGFDLQAWSIEGGYDQEREDALLGSIGWPEDGYRLFDIATQDESSKDGWFAPIAESNALFMRRALWEEHGGFDERFDMPGGGFANLDVYRRACELPGVRRVILLGEGTFHQVHGGASTNAAVADRDGLQALWSEQYVSIRGRPYQHPRFATAPTYVGDLTNATLSRFVRAAISPVRWPADIEPPLGAGFASSMWTAKPTPRNADPTIAALVELAHREFQAGRFEATTAVARLIRLRYPEEPEAQRLLGLVGLSPPGWPSVEYHVALADAHRLLGEAPQAEAAYKAALAIDPGFAEAHLGLAMLRMPGEPYLKWLERLYSTSSPASVIEVGVFEGASLAVVRQPTLAIGIDPEPQIRYPLGAETHIFLETSDAFFARHGPDAVLAGRPLGFGFIDGLHLFEQALRDFINLERYSGPQSVILIHDTVPLDEATQSRTPTTEFHTGDVWKLVLALRQYRPDLDVFTIATPPTGLTVVTGLDPTSELLSIHYDDVVERFLDTPFADIEMHLEAALAMVANDWITVEERLHRRGIL